MSTLPRFWNTFPTALRYWLAVGGFAVVLVVAVAIVLVGGSRAEVRLEQITPDNSRPIRSRPVWRVTFAQPIALDSVQGSVTLSPTISLNLRWVEETLEIRPQWALTPQTPYTLTIGGDLRTTDGVALQGAVATRFQSRASQVGYIVPAASGFGELWLMDTESGATRRLSAEGQSVRDFDPLPDGSALIYSVTEAENTESLWRVETADGAITRLTEGVGVVYESARVHPLGETLAVQIRREAQLADAGTRLGIPRLYLLNAATGAEELFIYGEGPNVANLPRWSPDGQSLAFYDTEMEAIGITTLTNTPAFFQAAGAFLWEQPWSPDSALLTYTLPDPFDATLPEAIVVRDLATGKERILLTPTLAPRAPAFNHDGTQLAYSFDTVGEGERQGGIGLIRPNGTGQRVLISEPTTTFSQPLWSPDGAWLLYGRFNRAEGATTQGLWLIGRDGGEPRLLAPVGLRPKWIP
jgi:Tol biopolymer transport system component